MITQALFPSAAPDYSDPLGLLRACHERIFQHSAMLEKLPRHFAEKGLDQEFCAAAEKIHRYYSTAAPHHHADEEQDLFPLLVRHSLTIADTVNQLKQEHEQLQAQWKELEPLLAKPSSIENPTAFEAQALRFAEANRRHAQKENEEVLEIAHHLLGRDEQIKLGRNMAERRGVSLPLNA